MTRVYKKKRTTLMTWFLIYHINYDVILLHMCELLISLFIFNFWNYFKFEIYVKPHTSPSYCKMRTKSERHVGDEFNATLIPFSGIRLILFNICHKYLRHWTFSKFIQMMRCEITTQSLWRDGIVHCFKINFIPFVGGSEQR